MTNQPEPLESAMRDLLSRLGLPDPGVFDVIRDEWEELASEPWAGQSRPAYLRKGELVVLVANPSLVALFRYAAGDLLRRLDVRLGDNVVESVRVIADR